MTMPSKHSPLANLFAMIRRLVNGQPMVDTPLGQLLVARKVITEEQLAAALAVQRERWQKKGQSVRLGQIFVELEMATEKTIVAAINENFGLKASSLSDNIREFITHRRATLERRIATPRIPIWARLCLGALAIVMVTMLSFSYFIITKQKARLFDQTITVGTVSLTYFVNNARIPLINNDILSLNTLIKGANTTKGMNYAAVVDNAGTIRAHTDVDRIGTVWSLPAPLTPPVTRDALSYFSFISDSGERLLNLSREVMFQEKRVGVVHVGVSLDFIDKEIDKEKRPILLMTLALLVIGLVIALFLGFRFSKPFKQLVTATEAIAQGDYHHRVKLKRKDELGYLAAAFNRMAAELLRHKLARESFGKYVGEEVLEMIVNDSEQMWLKGHENEATILFADIRGFTAYAEDRDPKTVVAMLNTYFEMVTRAILDHGGYVDKFIGDGVLGVFGVPVQRKDHVERAVRAALELTEKLQQNENKTNPLLSAVGIGIHTGRVVSGNIGSLSKMEYTVIGDTVNLASRISGLAAPGEILVTEEVRQSLDEMITVSPAGVRRVKGKTALIKTFRVMAIEGRRYVKSVA